MTSPLTTRPQDEAVTLRNRQGRHISVLVVLYSLLICFWAFSVGHRIKPVQEQNEVELAALSLASDLRLVTVPAKRLGPIGLTGMNLPGNRHVYGANSAAANLRAVGAIARSLELTHLQKLVGEDLDDLIKAEESLAKQLDSSIKPNYFCDLADGTRRSLYEHAYRIIAERASSSERTLVDLKIQLGKLRAPVSSSATPYVHLIDESLQYDDGKYYRTAMAVPVPGAGHIHFYDLAEDVKLVRLSDFQAQDEESSVASVIKVDATFESTIKGGYQKIISRESACAVVGSPRVSADPTALVISFPHGKINSLSCMQKLLQSPTTASLGDWHQAVEAAIPGKGHLAPPLGVEARPTPCLEAVQLALYHWLLSMGDELDPVKFHNQAQASWLVQVKNTSSSPQALLVNSAIIRDTGAPQFALLYQSKPGGAGQDLLTRAFNCASPELPHPALPLCVDEEGIARLPGHRALSVKLVKQFLQDLHQTNVAAIESRAVGQTVFLRMTSAIKASGTKIAAYKEELNAITRRRSGDESTKEQLEILNQKITEETDQQTRCSAIKQRAVQTQTNAEKAIRDSFAIGSDLKHKCNKGLFAITDGTPAYLLGLETVFWPHTDPVSEEDLYEKLADNQNAPGDWTSPDFASTGKPTAAAKVGDLTLSQYLSHQPETGSHTLYCALSSQAVVRSGKGKLRIFDSSPFARTGLPQAQLLYYNSDGFRTGVQPEVRWSCLVRDLLALRGQDLPPAELEGSWTNDDEGPGAGPTLACEIQVRAPLPLFLELPAGYTVQDPQGKEINLIPPLSADMY